MAAPRRRPPARRSSTLPAVPPGARRIAAYLAQHTWRGTRAATVWAGRNSAQLAVRTSGAAAAPVAAWSRDRAEYGWQPVFRCACGQRVPATEQAAHLATHEAIPAPRVEVPAGDAVLAAQPRRVVRGHIEVITEANEEPQSARPEPGRVGWLRGLLHGGRDVIACRCGEWVGHENAWARHAQVCPATRALRGQRAVEAYQRAVEADRPRLAEVLAGEWRALVGAGEDVTPTAVQSAPGRPAVGPTGAGAPVPALVPTLEVAVHDPTTWTSGSEILATPAIDPANYAQEVPAFLEGVAGGFDTVAEHFSGLVQYLQAANWDPDGATVSHISDAIGALHAAKESMVKAHEASADYVSTLPDFSRAG